MDRSLLKIIDAEMDAGGYGVLCTVTEEVGSTPRSRGASMWVRPDGSIAGTIGGGLVEYEAIQQALAMLESGEQSKNWSKKLTEEDGMACGGAATVYMEVMGREDEVVIFGAGHVGYAVSRAAAFVGFKVTVWDEREDFANQGKIPWARTVACPIDKIFDNGISLHDRSYVIIMTRGHSLDAEAVAITDGKPGAYYGMIGSRSKIATVREMLLKQGVSEAHLDRIYQPIGLPIKAETPEEIAVSIVAELIAIRRGGEIEKLRSPFAKK
jgi:xanthine dehydrogenase accessory factor